MTFSPDRPAEVALLVVMACWLGFGLILLAGKRQAAVAEIQRDTRSGIGFFLQGVGYAIAFGIPRPFFSSLAPLPKTAELILCAVTIAIAVASLWFCLAAVRALGKQWALVARVVEGHELITKGPYGIVRNPIYLAMFGMLIATELAVSRWQALVAGIIVFLAGNEIRIRSEEKLLREAFGLKFEDYARRVPGFLPRLF